MIVARVLMGLRSKVFLLALRLAVAAAFLVGAFVKLRNLGGAESTSSTIYESVTHSHSAMGYSFIVCEGLLGIWLLSGRFVRIAGLVSVIAFSIFIGFISVELRKERPKPCGCLTLHPVAKDVSNVRGELRFALVRDLGLLAAAGLLFVSGTSVRTSVPLRK
jgi:uncharacterized membrane protein YphA (DoxX/SURF4 family)